VIVIFHNFGAQRVTGQSQKVIWCWNSKYFF